MIKQGIVNHAKFKIDQFWDDCEDETTQSLMKSLNVKYDPPNNNIQEKIMQRKRRANSMEHTNQLYQIGVSQLEIKRGKHYNHKINKVKEDIDKCTWKPQLNEITQQQKIKFKAKGNDIYERELARQKEKWKEKQKRECQKAQCKQIQMIDYRDLWKHDGYKNQKDSS